MAKKQTKLATPDPSWKDSFKSYSMKLVNLFRVTGIFIQSDAGIRKKARRA